MAAPEQDDDSPQDAAEAAPISSGQPLPLEATRDDLLQCQLSSWFPAFRHLPADDLYQNRSNVTIKSKIIAPLPDDFMEFLLSDGIRLPQDATQLSSCAPNEVPTTTTTTTAGTGEDSEDETTHWDEDETDPPELVQYSFPALNQQLSDAIEALGGSVVPKLNWSTPKDATWVNEGSLKCQTPGDVYLLLKSSDFCLHDLQVYKSLVSTDQTEHHSGDTTTPPIRLELVLRKWCNFYPSMEFRCFVRNHVLSTLWCQAIFLFHFLFCVCHFLARHLTHHLSIVYLSRYIATESYATLPTSTP